MKSTKQPSVEELKNMTIYLRYVSTDKPPEEGLKRMTYYTELQDRPDKIYFGMSFRRATEEESLEEMVETGDIVELPRPVALPYEKDVWLNKEGEVVLASGYAPWEDKNPQVVAKPKELVDLIPWRRELSEIVNRLSPCPYYVLPKPS